MASALALTAVSACEGVMSAEAGADATHADAATPARDGGMREADSGDDAARPPEHDAGDGASDAGPREIPMFVAVGMMGRSTLSCDDGQTWVADRAFDTEGDRLVCGLAEPIVCNITACSYLSHGECSRSDPCDCGHHPGFGKGVAFGNGWFVATWGWGHPGSVRRSRDGVSWEDTLGGVAGFGGLAFGNDRFVLGSRSPYHSSAGIDWHEGDEADFRGLDGEIVWSVRKLVFIDDESSPRFIASAGPPDDVLISEDGQTWRRPAERPEGCVQGMGNAGGVAYGNGVTVAIGSDGRLCTSTDGGDHWTAHPEGMGATAIWSRVVLFDGSAFMVWGQGSDHDTRLYTSTDGTSWTGTVTDPPRVRVGPIARSEVTGTYVSSGHIWNDYDRQQFYRSADGVTWDTLPAGSFAPSHGVFELTFGYGEPSDACPAR